MPNRCHAAFELGENEGEKSKKAAERQSLCDGGRNRVRPDPMIKRHLFLCFLANRYGTRRGVLTNCDDNEQPAANLRLGPKADVVRRAGRLIDKGRALQSPRSIIRELEGLAYPRETAEPLSAEAHK